MNGTTDWYDVSEIGNGTYRIFEPGGEISCNIHLITDSDDALLIDTGFGIGDLRSVVEDLAGTDPRVLLTHSHWDHIGAAPEFDELLLNSRERTTDGTTIEFSDHDDIPALFIEECREAGRTFPDGFDPDTYSVEPVSGVDPVEPGDELQVGDRTIELLPIPGHSPGMIAALDRTAGICHAADLLEPGRKVFAHFTESNVEAYRESVATLVEYRDSGAFDTLTLAHATPFSGEDLSVLDDALEALTAVVDGTAQHETIDTYWGPTRKYTVADIDVLELS